jgi:hypothetical protein
MSCIGDVARIAGAETRETWITGAECVSALPAFGSTERQSRFLVLVLATPAPAGRIYYVQHKRRYRAFGEGDPRRLKPMSLGRAAPTLPTLE